jgi:hypothetical protein
MSERPATQLARGLRRTCILRYDFMRRADRPDRVDEIAAYSYTCPEEVEKFREGLSLRIGKLRALKKFSAGR